MNPGPALEVCRVRVFFMTRESGHSRLARTARGGTDYDMMSRALPLNGNLISSEEKLRLGNPAEDGEGMSPEADQGTGGADYSFMRLRKFEQVAETRDFHILMSKDILLDPDASVHPYDKY